MAEADAVGLDYAIETASVTDAATCQLFDLWYTGMCGARLHAKYLKPVSDEPVPLVLQFHGYPGASRSWFEQASFAGMGMALIALDCPGQGGPSEDIGGFEGTTVAGHIVAGIDGMVDIAVIDDAGAVCRCWNWRDGVRTALSDDSADAFLAIECVEPERMGDCQAAIDRLAELLERYLGATVVIKTLVTRDSPCVEL